VVGDGEADEEAGCSSEAFVTGVGPTDGVVAVVDDIVDGFGWMAVKQVGPWSRTVPRTDWK
jgi:hypothetical protein